MALFAGVVYVLLLLGVNTPLADQDSAWLPLVLILGTFVAFGLGSMLGADFARVRLVELELARTVAVHSGSGQAPESDSPLGRVLKEYAQSADEMRRHGRVHSYAAGPALWGAGFALAAAVLWGLSFTTGTVWVNYVAIVLLLPTIVLLFFSVSVLAFGIGFEKSVEGFDSLTPRRWRQFDGRSAAMAEAVATLPWLAELAPPSARAAGGPGSSASNPWSEGPAS